MLTNVKELLEPIRIPVTETCFKNPPSLPYIVFTESKEVGGADLRNMIADRDITIEFYSAKIDNLNESKIEGILNSNAIEFQKGERTWIDQDKFFMTPFYFSLKERID